SRTSRCLPRWCWCLPSSRRVSMAGSSFGARTLKPEFFVPVILLLVAAPGVFSSYWIGLLTQMLIFAILAMSLDILLGYTGLPSLGHAGIFGVAAYAVAVLSTSYHASFWVCVIGGIAVGTLLSASFGLLVSHVRNVY